ncbi:MAG: hypothetical protein R3B98_09765 [Hyphomonas sp.]
MKLPFGLEIRKDGQVPAGDTWMLSDVRRALAHDGITVPEPAPPQQDATETSPEE